MRLVIKLGTSLLTSNKGQLDTVFLSNIVSQIAALKKQKHEIVVVSSGAVGAGRGALTISREKKSIPYRQALAAVGQGILMKTYHELFAEHGFIAAQALLTNYDFVNRENFLNTKNVFELLLKEGTIPVVNENDVTTIAELKFGDNDMLSAKTAAMVSADLLIILTDVDGLYLEDPKKNPEAKLLAVVSKIDEKIHALAGGARSKGSMGGMVTKLLAAEYVTSVGIPMWIAGGRKEGVLQSILGLSTSNLGTFFPSSISRTESAKKWLRPKIQKNAWVEVDTGAAAAIQKDGKSLLPSGVVKVHGEFSRGDVILVKGPDGEVGYGQSNYSALEVDKIKKHRSDKIEGLLGYSFEPELIHRDRMVVI